jgi:hypothetical protein
VKSCAELLGIDESQIFPVSAQKGLLAKISGDEALLKRSRLTALEKALSDELISSKQAIVRDQTEAELGDLLDNSLALLEGRRRGIEEQLNELKGLQGKNQDVVGHIMTKITADKETFRTRFATIPGLALGLLAAKHQTVLPDRHGRAARRSPRRP